MENWKLLVLKHDTASDHIKRFFEQIWADKIESISPENTHPKEYFIKELKKELKSLEEIIKQNKILTLYGNGNYHHCTYGLCYNIARKKSEDYMYIHIDKHTDATYPLRNSFNCAAFVENIVEEPNAKDILFIGTSWGDNLRKRENITQQLLMSEDSQNKIREVLRNKNQTDTYCSLDLDVLNETEVSTAYPQGEIKLEHLLKAISVIQEEKNIISADMLGYNPKGYEYGYDPVSLLTYATLAAKITGKDTKELENLHKYFKQKEQEAKREFDYKSLKNEFEKITKQLRI